MVSTFIGLLDIQSWWEIPCIAHFCSLFSSAFNLPDIDIEDLESALLTDGTDDSVGLLPELIVSLLNGCDSVRNQHSKITTCNYQMFLRRFLRYQCRQYNTENYFDTDVDFQALPLRNKLLILYSLCHFRLDSKNVQDILSNLQADSLRVEPLGYDSRNSGYWYFYGTRLYREDIKAGGKNTVWQVICFTEEDWQNLAAKFQNSTSPKERALYNILTQNFLPKLPQLFRERERLRRRKLLQVRNSVRIRALGEEKQKQLDKQKEEAEQLEKQKHEERLKSEAANRNRRTRRRSSQSSTGTGISTYASSVKGGSINSSEFLVQREKFCLSPDAEDNQSSTKEINDITDTFFDYSILSEEIGKEFPSSDIKRKHSIENKHSKRQANQKQQQQPQQNFSSSHDTSKNCDQILDQEDKENCFLPSNSSTESELSGSENIQSSDQRIEMAPTTNAKLPGRQTNNSLSTLTGNIFLPNNLGNNSSGATSNEGSKGREKSGSSSNSGKMESSGRKKKSKSNEVKNRNNSPPKTTTTFLSFTETDEVLQIGMHKVLVYVKNHRDAWPFMDPVEEDIAPRYYSIIRRPMDILKMEEKLDNGEYTKFSAFRNDFKLIVNNCRLYNGQNNEYTEMVNNLQEAFDKATKKYFDHISSDEEGNMSYPDSKTNVFREKYFNKTNTNKVIQNDNSNNVKKGKESSKHDKKCDTNNERIIEDEIIEGSRVNKRKRKDKDKRRKKKSKTKLSSNKSETEDNEYGGDEDLNEEEESNDEEQQHKQQSQFPNVQHKNRDSVSEENIVQEDSSGKNKKKSNVVQKITEHRKRKETSSDESHQIASSGPPNKKSKKKSEILKTEESEGNRKSKPTSNKKSNQGKSGNNKKQPKSRKALKTSKKKQSTSDNEGDVSTFEEEEEKEVEEEKEESEEAEQTHHFNKTDKEFSSDNSMIDYPLQTKSHSKKHSSSQHSSCSASKIAQLERTKSTNISNTKNKPEKENQSSKSKTKRSTSNTSINNAVEEQANKKPKNVHKDSKKQSNNNSKKKRSKSNKKQDNIESSTNNQILSKRRESLGDSSSRSPSPLFKVDLHKKYAKSASNEIEDEFDSNKNKFSSTANNSSSKKQSIKNDNDYNLMSISCHSLSCSPLNIMEPEQEQELNRGKTKGNRNNASSKSKKNSSSKANSIVEKSPPPPSSKLTQETDLKLPPFMDKYDLIKQRRNRNTEEKWNQIVKEAEKIKDNKKSTPTKPVIPPSKEKNQKLRETIEKLKAKNAKSKERSVFIDEIFGVKPTQEVRDEKTIFEKQRETCPDTKEPSASPVKKTESNKKADEENSGETTGSSVTKGAKKKEVSEHKKPRSISPKKASSKKPIAANETPTNSTTKNCPKKKTNMVALELETEQTLKDINRWLEHTPRYPEYSSASNSPSRYNLLDDFDAVAAKLDPNDFRRSVPIAPPSPKVDAVSEILEEIVENKSDVIPELIPTPANSTSTISNETTAAVLGVVSPTPSTSQIKSKESTSVSTTQLLSHPPPPPPHVKSQLQKETKRKSLKEKLTNPKRRKDLLRTIDRLQPGKAKGNLLTNIHNVNKPDEIFPLGAAAKIKEVKNSLVVKTDETAPKLSLGSVLNTEGFGLGQLHNFGDNVSSGDLKTDSGSSNSEKQDEKDNASPVDDKIEKVEECDVKQQEEESKVEEKNEKSSATPNLSAWFKAFGAPKAAKKAEEEEKKIENTESVQATTPEKSTTSEQSNNKNPFNSLKSPQPMENFSLPAPRQRKASTGSTISERSSFSQDPDSPRVGIDDRFGTYSGPYTSPIGASPIGASPIMISPKPDEITKPTSPYPLNGAIKVGFYQDTTTKSSPEKSCSPRELPSPYPQYSQHIYSSAASTNISNDINSAYVGCFNTTSEQNKNPMYTSASPSPIYEQYKQPHSQESDYNSSMSPSTNPNSPYHQPQTSPYQQNPNSPYQQTQNSPYQQPQNSPYQQPQTSPYQQPQTSPFQNQSGNSQGMMATQSPNSSNLQPQQQQQQQCDSSRDPNTPPYQQSASSPYQHPTNSSYNQQNPTTSYQQPQPQPQQQQQQTPLNFGQQPNTNSTTLDSNQQVGNDQPFSQENPQYSMHEANSQYSQGPSQSQMNYEQELPKSPPNIMNKISPRQEWNNPVDVTGQPPQQTNPGSLPIMGAISAPLSSNQLNTSPLQPVQGEKLNTIHHLPQQQDGSKELQYQRGYQYPTSNKDSPKSQGLFNNDLSLDVMQQQQQQQQQHQVTSQEQIMKNNHQQGNIPKISHPQTSEADLINMGYPSESQTNKLQKQEQEKPFDSTLNKHQQMFDSFLGSMAAGKGIGFGKPLDISTSKAFEMFNRAATMGFSKDFPNPLLGNNKIDSVNSPLPPNHMVNQSQQLQQQQQQQQQPPPQQQQGYLHIPSGEVMENPRSSIAVPSNKTLTMVNSNYNQPQVQQMQMNPNDSGKIQTFQNLDTKLHQQQPPSIFTQKLPQQQQQQQQQQSQPQQQNSYPPNLIPSPIDKINNELIIPNPRQDQMSSINRNQHINMDMTNYKPTYNNPSTGMLDPLRNLNHPLAMVDESMLGLQNSPPTGYYDKNIPTAHMFSKNLGQQVYQNPAAYGGPPPPPREQQNPAGVYPTSVSNVPTSQNLEVVDVKVSKRSKKKKTPTPTPIETSSANNQNPTNVMLSGQPQQQQQHSQQQHQQQLPLQGQPHPSNQNPQGSQNPQQGFQLYSGLKTAAAAAATSVPSTTDTSAISLKSATSMVPGSAFNFGPSPTGLGLPAGIYGDNTGYLEEFRGAPNPYYISPGHRSTPEAKTETPGNPNNTAPGSAAYHQFLTHTSSRSSYPFMNSPQLDPNSPIYQQYLQRQEELRARMMLNQGLLPPGAAAGYPHPQAGYRPSLGIPKPYDMNRQPWF